MRDRSPLTLCFRVKGRSRAPRQTIVLIAFLLAAANAPNTLTATLRYEAFLASVRIGTAEVQVERNSLTYEISGTASVSGAAHLFSNWHSVFYASGHFQDGGPALSSYGYEEQERKKYRVLSLRDGVIRQVKNGKTRPARPVLDGMDVLTAFFIEPDCWTNRLLHTGRYNYRIQGRASASGEGCLFEVRDEDGDRTRIHVVFGEHEGVKVPVHMRTRGFLRGSIALQRAATAGASNAGVAD